MAILHDGGGPRATPIGPRDHPGRSGLTAEHRGVILAHICAFYNYMKAGTVPARSGRRRPEGDRRYLSALRAMRVAVPSGSEVVGRVGLGEFERRLSALAPGPGHHDPGRHRRADADGDAGVVGAEERLAPVDRNVWVVAAGRRRRRAPPIASRFFVPGICGISFRKRRVGRVREVVAQEDRRVVHRADEDVVVAVVVEVVEAGGAAALLASRAPCPRRRPRT